jgi:hypothetical protein
MKVADKVYDLQGLLLMEMSSLALLTVMARLFRCIRHADMRRIALGTLMCTEIIFGFCMRLMAGRSIQFIIARSEPTRDSKNCRSWVFVVSEFAEDRN